VVEFMEYLNLLCACRRYDNQLSLRLT